MNTAISWQRYELISAEQLSALDAIEAHSQQLMQGSIETFLAVDETESKEELDYREGNLADVPEPLRQLRNALKSCNDLSKQLDSCVEILDSIGSSYDTVSSRTTALVHNCEEMLYQQTSLQELAEKVEKYLEPFGDMEDLARSLGVPFTHQRNGPVSSATTRSNLSADELSDISSRLDRVGEFFRTHPEIQQNAMYSQWLTRLRHRATSLVVLSAKKAIDSAFKEASTQMQSMNKARLDGSLESSPIYSRFRAILPRLSKVCVILEGSHEIPLEESVGVILQHYITRRSELLSPLVNNIISNKDAEPQTDNDSMNTLPAVVRRVYASLQRVVQVEVQLFQSAFQSNKDPTAESDTIAQELADLLELLCVKARDGLRPIIIRQASLEDLCRAVVILHEDVKQQFENLRVAPEIRRRLQMVVEATVSDAQERLLYIADLRIRSDVEYFEPSAADVSYPEVLQQPPVEAARTDDSVQPTASSVGADWYPPLRTTLTVLSRLYNVLELEVFEDIAGHCVGACTIALTRGAEAVKKRTSSPLHGNLFLVRHTLLLREQLLPFNIRFTAVERVLDFSNATAALSKMVRNSRSLLRFDSTNALLKFAQDGIPKLEQTQVDGKRKLDESVRLACAQLTSTLLQDLAEPLNNVITKLRAFLDIFPGAPTEVLREKLAEFDLAKIQNLSRQAFLRPERFKGSLQGMTQSIETRLSEFLSSLTLYIANAATRSVLIRPIQSQFELAMADAQCVVQAILEKATADSSDTWAQGYDEVNSMLVDIANVFQRTISQTL